MLKKRETGCSKGAAETMHRQMEIRVVIVDGPKERAYFDFGIQFFVYFPA